MKQRNKSLVIEYYSKGGNFPYQAEGKIDEKLYFYFRSRHQHCQLELFKTKKDLDNLQNNVMYIQVMENSFLNDDEADILIRKLYNLIKNCEWIK